MSGVTEELINVGQYESAIKILWTNQIAYYTWGKVNKQNMRLRFNIVFIFLCSWLLKMLNKIIAIIKLLKLFYLMYNITTASTKSNTHGIIMSVIKYTSTGSPLRNLKHAWYNYVCYKVYFNWFTFTKSQTCMV